MRELRTCGSVGGPDGQPSALPGRRRGTACAPASLRLLPAPEAQRWALSSSNRRLFMKALLAKVLLACVLADVILGTALASAEAEEHRQEQIRFEKGASGTTITGMIKGDRIVDYQLLAGEGQSMVAILKPTNLSVYFNILPPVRTWRYSWAPLPVTASRPSASRWCVHDPRLSDAQCSPAR